MFISCNHFLICKKAYINISKIYTVQFKSFAKFLRNSQFLQLYHEIIILCRFSSTGLSLAPTLWSGFLLLSLPCVPRGIWLWCRTCFQSRMPIIYSILSGFLFFFWFLGYYLHKLISSVLKIATLFLGCLILYKNFIFGLHARKGPNYKFSVFVMILRHTWRDWSKLANCPSNIQP